MQYKGDTTPTQQFMRREGFGAVLDVAREGSFATFNSLTSYRDGQGAQLMTETGAGPEALGWSLTRWQQYIAFVNSRYSATRRRPRTTVSSCSHSRSTRRRTSSSSARSSG